MHTGERSAVAPPMPWVMWTTPAFLFLIGFFHRAVSGAIPHELMHELEAVGATVGVLAATYIYAYARPAAGLSLLMRATRGRNIDAQPRGPAMRKPA